MITLEQVEEGIYIYHWVGHVTMYEAEEAIEKFKASHDNTPYVAIINMAEMTNIPHDIPKMTRLIKEDTTTGLIGYVALSVPKRALGFIKPLTLLAPTTYYFADSIDEALITARNLLCKHTPNCT